MNLKKIKLYIDILFCGIFLPLIIALVPVEKWIERYPVFAITLISFLYCVYFIIRTVNIPQLVIRRKLWKLCLWVGGLTLAAYLLSIFPYPESNIPVMPEHPRLHEHLRTLTAWFMFLVVSGYGLSFSLLMELFRQIMVKKEIEEQKNKAELSLYKAQINPHFMFNTLNTLYGLTISKSDKAEDAFVKFIEILKYTYTQVGLDMIPIGSEIRYIQDYISLQTLRLNSHTKVNWMYDIDDEDVPIPPMILITFVENAFKYGTSSSRDCIIGINAELHERHLSFSVINSIMRDKGDDGISVGLNNCTARLNLMYPGCHSLSIVDEHGVFKVSLSIKL